MAKYRKLSKTSSQRKALLRNQVTALLQHGKIVTTEARAKEIRKIVEPLIALAVKEKDNFDLVKVNAKVARKDANGKRVKEVVGETTYGKGVIQGVYPSSTGGALKATIEEYFGPGELKLNKKGVEPTIKVEQTKKTRKEVLEENKGKTEEELQEILMKYDLQLQKAIEVLQQ